MAKLHHVKAARKAYRKHGIKKGQEYWWIKFARCSKLYFARHPRPSQIERSPYRRSILAIQEELELDNNPAGPTDYEVAGDAIEEIIEELEASYESVSAKFPNGCPSLELLSSRIEDCHRIREELREAMDVAFQVEEDGRDRDDIPEIDWSTE